jgi:hypothetical protein
MLNILILGFRHSDLRDAILFIDPIVRVTRADVKPGVVIPRFKNVDARDQHNIQTGFGQDDEKLIAEIKKLREDRKRFIQPKKSHRSRPLFE